MKAFLFCAIFAFFCERIDALSFAGLRNIFAGEEAEPSPRPSTCMRPECFESASMIGSKMNFSADPCQDFYSFACGGWDSRNEIPDDESTWGLFSVLTEETADRVKKLLEAEIEDEDEEIPETIVKTLYKQCLDTKKMEKKGIEILESSISAIGGWAFDEFRMKDPWSESNWNFNKALTKSHMEYANSALFGNYVGDDEREPTVNRMGLYPRGLSLLTAEEYFSPNSSKCLAYRNLTTRLATLMGLDQSKADVFTDKIWEFETRLAKITPLPHEKESMDPTLRYNKMPFSVLMDNYSYIDWKQYFSSYTKLTDDADIIMNKKSYFVKLQNILNTTSSEDCNHYLVHRLIQESVPFLNKDFRLAMDDFNLVASGSMPKSRDKYCARFVVDYADTAVGAMYVKKYFPPESKENVETMIEDLRDVFKEHVDALDWMDIPTKKKAKLKADAMIPSVGYPDFVMNATKLKNFYKNWVVSSNGSLMESCRNYNKYQILKANRLLTERRDRDSWEGNGATVNAFYYPQRNSIIFPAGILQKPFYHLDLPMYVNYAAIGTVIGHEISHGFDDNGAKYGPEGKMDNWWTPESWTKFSEKTKCFVDYFDKYQVQGLNVRGNLTLGENIADTGGLSLTFDAYRKWQQRQISKGGKMEERLPGIPLTVNQLFFVSYGQVWCSKQRRQRLERLISTDYHSPGPIRTIGPPSLLPQFREAFQCKSGSQMAPEKTCTIW